MSTAYGASYAPLPTAAENASARARISSQRDDIQCAEQEIIGLEGQIAVLRDQIAAMRNDIERLRDAIALEENTIAPVRRIPSDIVAAIVILVATAQDAYYVRTLRTLSSINRVWRDITLDTPQAWAKIAFSYRTFGGSALPTLSDLDEWLSRSKACPQDFSLHGHDMRSSDTQLLCDMVRSRFSQLRSFSLSGLRLLDATTGVASTAFCVRQILSTGGTMPHLEHLDLLWHDESPVENILATIVHQTPRLTSVVLNDLSQPVPHALCLRLRSLSLLGIFLSDLLGILMDLPVLRSLRIFNLACKSTLDASELNAAPVLRNLRLLCVGFKDEAVSHLLFRSLKTPHLEALALRHSAWSDDRGLSPENVKLMLQPLIDLHPPLRWLYLQGLLLDEEVLIKILGDLVLLERLFVGHKLRDLTKLCAALSDKRPGSEEWLCSSLSHIFISACGLRLGEAERNGRRSPMERVARARYAADGVRTLVTVQLRRHERRMEMEEHW